MLSEKKPNYGDEGTMGVYHDIVHLLKTPESTEGFAARFNRLAEDLEFFIDPSNASPDPWTCRTVNLRCERGVNIGRLIPSRLEDGGILILVTPKIGRIRLGIPLMEPVGDNHIRVIRINPDSTVSFPCIIIADDKPFSHSQNFLLWDQIVRDGIGEIGRIGLVEESWIRNINAEEERPRIEFQRRGSQKIIFFNHRDPILLKSNQEERENRTVNLYVVRDIITKTARWNVDYDDRVERLAVITSGRAVIILDYEDDDFRKWIITVSWNDSWFVEDVISLKTEIWDFVLMGILKIILFRECGSLMSASHALIGIRCEHGLEHVRCPSNHCRERLLKRAIRIALLIGVPVRKNLTSHQIVRKSFARKIDHRGGYQAQNNEFSGNANRHLFKTGSLLPEMSLKQWKKWWSDERD